MFRFLKSFVYAFKGITVAMQQRNMKIHIIAVVVVSAAGLFFQIDVSEWLLVFFCFALVISLEMVNTAIEILADTLHPQQHEGIAKVKDVAAGAVLVSAFFSVIIAYCIFYKHLKILFA